MMKCKYCIAFGHHIGLRLRATLAYVKLTHFPHSVNMTDNGKILYHGKKSTLQFFVLYSSMPTYNLTK